MNIRTKTFHFWTLPLALVAIATAGCGETNDGESGTGGSGGSAGIGGSAGMGGDGGTSGTGGVSTRTVDQTCRDWCANEPQAFSCFTGPVGAVADCYRGCTAFHQSEVERQCGDEWIATLNCELGLDCSDLFGDCEPLVLEYDACASQGTVRVWCEDNCPEFDLDECTEDPSECSAHRSCETDCPTQDHDECVEEHLSTGACALAGVTSTCRVYCQQQDLLECIDQWQSTGLCEFDTASGACQFGCPDVGAPFNYCIEVWNDTGMCPDGPPPPIACVEARSMCQNGTIDPIQVTCSLPSPPTQANGCTGTESLVNPASCTLTGATVTHQLTAMESHDDCNVGYDLDACNGNSCVLGGLAPGEGVGGVDNALTGLAPVLAGVGGNIGGVDQAFHDAMCTGAIDITFVIDTNAGENCATVEIRDGGALVDTVILNRSDAECLSGTLGTLPLNVAGVPGALENGVVRMTVSSDGFSDGVLGATTDRETAAAIADQLIDGGSAVVAQVLDITENLEGDANTGCNALSMTMEIGGAAIP